MAGWVARAEQALRWGWPVGIAGLLGYRFVDPEVSHLAHFFDDFYYYLVVAEHWVFDGSPTFDGVVATNGVHPLWFGVVSGLLWVFGGSSLGFFVAVTTVVGLGLWGAFEAHRAALRSLGVGALTATSTAWAVSVVAVPLATAGLETAAVLGLSAALNLWLLRRPWATQTLGAAAATGLLASLVVLARIDAVFYVAAFLVAVTAAAPSWRRLAAFGAGGMLLPIWLVVDRALFGAWLPVSGAAKQLVVGGLPTMDLKWGFFGFVPSFAALTHPIYLLYAATAWGLIGAASSPRQARPALAAALVAPYLVWSVYLLRSDWGLSFWYAYPLPLAVVAAVGLALPGRGPDAERRWTVLMLWFGAVHLMQTWTPWLGRTNTLWVESQEIAAELAREPMRTAMGDRAGTLAYLLPGRALVQTEGLVMDRAFVDAIAAERDLIDVLQERGAQRLVVTRPGPPAPPDPDGCYRVEEPSEGQAGTRSAKLRGRFCDAPVWERAWPHGGYTRVFRVP